MSNSKKLFMLAVVLFSPLCLFAAGVSVPSIGPVRIEFIIFGIILLGVALFHKQTFRFASHQQDKYQRIQKDANLNVKIDWVKIFNDAS